MGRSDIPSQDECAESLDVSPLSQIRLRDANHITAGGIHGNRETCQIILHCHPHADHKMRWMRVRWIFENFLSLIKEHFRAWVIDRIFRHQSVSNHGSCKRFVTFLASEILKQKAIGVLRVWVRVDVNESPYLLMHKVEPISYPEPTFLLVSTKQR